MVIEIVCSGTKHCCTQAACTTPFGKLEGREHSCNIAKVPQHCQILEHNDVWDGKSFLICLN
jgi:hypothetical protein